MTEISHFLVPGGWKITRKNRNSLPCSQLLPESGTTILIGRSKSANACTVAWMDSSGFLRRVDNLVSKGEYWEALILHEGQYYVVTIWKNPKSQRGIVGDVQLGRRSKIVKDEKAGSMSSTWGAEANPGGGGGKTGYPSSKGKSASKPNGSGVELR